MESSGFGFEARKIALQDNRHLRHDKLTNCYIIPDQRPIITKVYVFLLKPPSLPAKKKLSAREWFIPSLARPHVADAVRVSFDPIHAIKHCSRPDHHWDA